MQSGYATYTGSGYEGGAMLLDPIPSDMEITAVNPTNLNYNGINAALGGAYLEVQGPKGTTTVYTTDLYPEGAPGALDLSPNAFSKIGNMEEGRINIQWKIVRGPVSGNIVYRVKEGSSQWWAAIQVRNHAIPILKMAYYKDGNWVNMEKTPYNHFLASNLGTNNLQLRLEAIDGTVKEDTIQGMPSDAVSKPYFIQGNIQF
uniref:Expansin-YoaJ n=1 Tax=Acrobeloides nanus TaxID=290746 RepID=A0A914C0D8_9BILA